MPRIVMPEGPEEAKLYIRHQLPWWVKPGLTILIMILLAFVIGNVVGQKSEAYSPEVKWDDAGQFPVSAYEESEPNNFSTHEQSQIQPELNLAPEPAMPRPGYVDPETVLVEPDPSVYLQPTPGSPPDDPWAGIDNGHLVPHPRREPDALIQVKVSWYNPELGGPNCFRFVNGYCQSALANGERWEDNYGVALACPREFEFGTVIEFGGKRGVCKDRGGKIVQVGYKLYWVDQLLRQPDFAFGTQLVASVWYP